MLLSLVLAAGVSARVMDRVARIPHDWAKVRTASPSDPISLKIALRQQHAEALEQAVLDMSTPGHSNYGMHMTRDEVRQYTAPSESAAAAVLEWLSQAGIGASVDNDWVSFTTTVSTAEKLLGTEFDWYQSTRGGDAKLRTLQYSVPDHVVAHVDLVQPTTRFGQLEAQKSTIFDLQPLGSVKDEDVGLVRFAADQDGTTACGSPVTPDCLRSLYNVRYTAAPDGNLVAFCSYLEQYARYDDFESFQDRYVPAAEGQNFTVELVSGGKDDQDSLDDSGEANLDVQYILGLSHPIPILEYSTGGRGPLVPTKDQPQQPGSNEPYLEFLTYILAQDDASLPQTLSTSYGEEEQSVPQEYALKVCNMFMQLGARGVSVIFSSGDSGPGNSCVRNTDNAPFFNPTFPAGCPFVTAVGATTGTSPERAVGFSSGGFSIYHAQPSYQNAAVPGYLQKLNDTYKDFYNSSGRGIPDVAAQGTNYAVVDSQMISSLSGTSASAPTFAGIVALLNAARKSQNQPPLGFLNPWLYDNSAAFTDIDKGYGAGCVGNVAFKGGARWNATTGWDPVTGLGTPKFDLLLEAAAPGTANL